MKIIWLLFLLMGTCFFRKAGCFEFHVASSLLQTIMTLEDKFSWLEWVKNA